MIARIFQIAAIILMMLACHSSHNLGYKYVVGPRTQNLLSGCNTASSYSYSHEYVDSYKGNAVVIHSQVELGDRHFSARDVGYITHLVGSMARKHFAGQGIDSWRFEALERMMEHTLVIVVPNNDNLSDIWSGPTTEDTIAKSTRSIATCFDTPNNTWVFAIINDYMLKDGPSKSAIVVHEAMHIVGLTLFGTYDGGHKDPRLWMQNGGSLSYQSLVASTWNDDRFSR